MGPVQFSHEIPAGVRVSIDRKVRARPRTRRTGGYGGRVPTAEDAARGAQGGLAASRRPARRCPQLAATRHTVVFGAGNADADLMFVGEAPGANEDEQGLPFVGQAGRLLDDAARRDRPRARDVFIANTLKCRPPGNRDPLPDEIDACQD